jgi:hypothetical protein
MLQAMVGLMLGVRMFDVGHIPTQPNDQVDISSSSTWRYGVYLHLGDQGIPDSVRFGAYRSQQGVADVEDYAYHQISVPQSGKSMVDLRAQLSFDWERAKSQVSSAEQAGLLTLNGILLDMWDLQSAIESDEITIPDAEGGYVSLPGGSPLLTSSSSSRPAANSPFLDVAVENRSVIALAFIGSDGRAAQQLNYIEDMLSNSRDVPLCDLFPGWKEVRSAARPLLRYNKAQNRWESSISSYTTDSGLTSVMTLADAQLVYRACAAHTLTCKASALVDMARYHDIKAAAHAAGADTANTVLGAVMPVLSSCLTTSQWKQDSTPTTQTQLILDAVHAMPAPEPPDLKPLYANIRANDGAIIALLACIYGSQIGQRGLEDAIKLLEKIKYEHTGAPAVGETLANSPASPLDLLFNNITSNGTLK